MKYVVTKDEDGVEEIFIFPKRYNHDEFVDTARGLKVHVYSRPNEWVRVRRKPIAAGFTDGKTCHGRSESLNLDSRGRLDEMLIE